MGAEQMPNVGEPSFALTVKLRASGCRQVPQADRHLRARRIASVCDHGPCRRFPTAE